MKTLMSSFFCLILLQFTAQEIQTKSTNSTPVTNSNELLIQDSVVKTIEIKGVSKKEKTKSDKMTITTKDVSSEKKAQFYSLKTNISTQSTQRSPSPVQQTEMNNTVSYYAQNTPNSFESHYFKYVAGNYNVDLINDLLEAQKLKPNNVDVQVQLAAYNFIKHEDKKLVENLEFLLKNKKIESEVLIYAEHLLNSVSENGTLITHGFDDTYSVMYMQKVKKIRSDVTVLSLDFMQSEFYRNRLVTEKFTIPSNTKCIDVTYLKAFCERNPSKNIHLSMTFPKPYLAELVSDSQISGLAFAYKNENQNLTEFNQGFYKTITRKDQITKFESEKCKQLSSNYLPFLLSYKKELEGQTVTEDLKDSNIKDNQKDNEKHEIQNTIDKIYIQAKINQSIKSYK